MHHGCISACDSLRHDTCCLHTNVLYPPTRPPCPTNHKPQTMPHSLQDTERLQDLLNTLAILWASTAVPSPRPSSPRLGSGSGQRVLAVRRRPSVEGLNVLHGELVQLQRQLQEGGQQGSRAASPMPEA